jgi:hypothetical protein
VHWNVIPNCACLWSTVDDVDEDEEDEEEDDEEDDACGLRMLPEANDGLALRAFVERVWDAGVGVGVEAEDLGGKVPLLPEVAEFTPAATDEVDVACGGIPVEDTFKAGEGDACTDGPGVDTID